MKRLEITAPKKQKKKIEAVLEEYVEEEFTSSEVEKEDRSFLKFELTVDSDVIDDLTEAVKDITEIESGELTIDILEETAQIEKGRRRKGGTSSLSVQEMYSKAFSFATFDKSSWALIALASGIAVLGIFRENVMVVIGAMVIAPMLGPFISTSFGLVIGDRKLIKDSVFFSILSIFFAVAVSFLLALPIPMRPNPLMRLIADPGFMTIPLSLLVGAAAAMTFTTENRESLAGVAVAIALVPPAAVVGIALSLLDIALFIDVLLVLVTNVAALILAGSITFKLVGVAPSTYYRKKVSEEKLREALIISVASIIVIGGIVGYLSLIDYQDATLRTSIETQIADEIQQPIIQQSVSVTRSGVHVELIVVEPIATAQQLESEISEMTDRPITVELTAVRGEVAPR